MKLNNTVVTLALVGVLALAALAGGLLPAGHAVHAAEPVFDTDTGPWEVPENTPPGVNIGNPVSATDGDEDGVEFGDMLEYSLGDTDAASFDIDPSTGQLITKAPLQADGNGAQTAYNVTVTVEDSTGATETTNVTITVRDVDEPPAAPFPPTVVSGEDDSTTDNVDESTATLKVIWHEPENTGPGFTDYDVEYKKTTESTFLTETTGDITHTGANTIATIGGLEANTSYQVRVRAKNGEADTTENWSVSGVGSTNKADNGEPSFDETGDGSEETLTRRVDENEPAREDIGHEVRANSHVDDNVLTYRLDGPDAELFDFITSSGQIRTKASLNHEAPRCYVENDPSDASDTDCFYYVTVAVFDGQGGSDARPVKIKVRDRSEAPDAPARATVRATAKSSRSLDVSWNAPRNPGPPITSYEIRYRKGTSGTYLTIEDIEGTSTTIAPTDANLNDGDDRLTPGKSYQVHVRAKTAERNSEWSAVATGSTSVGNQEPVFDDRPDQEAARTDRTVDRTVNENTRAGQPVGGSVRARDRNPLTYKLVAAASPNNTDFEKFDINELTGQILTKDSLNHEDTGCGYDPNDEPNDPTECTFMVKVEVRDSLDEHGNKEADDAAPAGTLDDEITVRIIVRDVVETPKAPTLTVTSPEVAENAGSTGATLVVTWDMPENTGPPITSYEMECSGAEITSSDQCSQLNLSDFTLAVQTYTIENITPNSSYQVRVRAHNAEGVGAWSTAENQSTSVAGNSIPTIATPTPTPTVSEDDRSGSAVGDPVIGSDGDSTGRLTYEIEGPNKDLFSIDTSGQIKTRKTLNHEDPRCYDDANPTDTECEYTVRVKVSDNQKGSAFENVTIEVTDVEEPPSAPATPTVTATKDTGMSLDVTWNEPTNKGPAITGYQIAYRKYRQGTNTDEFVMWPHVGTEREATITTIGDPVMPLEPLTDYEVRVRATNGEGTAPQIADRWGDWSALRRARTGASNERPVFAITDLLITLDVPENTRAGQNVGSAVEATDADRGNRLRYSLEGPGKDSFDINSSTGQIRTRSGVTYDYESRQGYSVTVKVDDGQSKDNSVATKSVTIDVEDRDEPPSTPGAPRVVGIAGSTDSVRVTWEEPANTGPVITDYDVQCQNCPTRVYHDGADRSMIITDLTPGTRYNVQVRARNAEGHSDWSRSGTGSPNADVANQRPIFSGGGRSFAVTENSVVAGDAIGTPVTAVDPDRDPVTHTLEGTDATSFSIDAGSGQIRATGGLDHEEKSRYSVTVKATDTRGGSSMVGVTITVTDVNEPPAKPDVPTVTPASSTSLQVTWDAPENTGPPITDYDYRYREPLGSWTEVSNTTIRGTTVTIERLRASTSYDVEVRATNAEGTSDWSNSGYGLTAAAGANSPPVFDEGTSATRSVRATVSAGTSIGQPVRAMDSDQADTLEYSLEGTDAASFDINTSTGQLLTLAGVTLVAETTYEVEVVASDGTDSARIPVSIEVTTGPPNNLPVFSAGPRSFTVRANASAGTAIGSVTATDADGDTVTYSLEGTDEASFDIVSTSGQIRTKAGVTLTAGTTYTVEVVVSDTKDEASITVTITVIDNTPPAFPERTTRRFVPENSPVGTDVGGPFSATDPDRGDTLTYTLSGLDAASFTIGPNGQIMTLAELDYETKNLHVVVVTATDTAGDSATITVIISVTDVGLPEAPDAPTVTETAGSTTSLDVSWTAPSSDAAIADYDVQYRAGSTGGFTSWSHDGDGTSTVITGLTDGTSYEVQVRAQNSEGPGDWSASGIGTTSRANHSPVFGEGTTAERFVPENSPVGTDVVGPFSATDPDGDTLNYTLGDGADAGSFTIDGSTGQISTAVVLDYETKNSYTVTVTATDSGSLTDTIAVIISVTDVGLPEAPDAPTVTETAGSTTSLDVSWTAPSSDATIADYDVQYRAGSTGGFTSWSHDGDGTSTVITGLTDGTSYEVQVRAQNSEGPGDWSASGIGTTSRANHSPVFGEGTTAERFVPENSPVGTDVVGPFSATDPDGDTLNYTLGDGADAGSFTIDGSTGQISTAVVLDYETKNSYTVTVTATDSGSLTDTIAVIISVTDVGLPEAPDAPTVTETAGSTTSLDVSWTAPSSDATIADYDVQYRAGSTGGFTSWSHDGDGTSTVITGLTDGTSYEVQVRAQNSEGPGDWSASGIGTTTRANHSPAFPGLITSRSVAEGQPASAAVGGPVSAADPDQGDTLTYTLSGPDEASFTIGSNGQISTAVVLDYETKSFHGVVVTATDTAGASATITVFISVTNVDPPDAPGAPTVTATAGSTMSLDVSWTAPSSDAAIADYDVQYRAGSTGGFTPWSHDGDDTSTVITGLADGTSYEVQVRAQNSEGPGDWSASGIGTTSRANHSPVFGEGTTAERFVPENSPVGTDVVGPFSATDPDGDTLNYTLGDGADAGSFTIDGSTGQISTAVVLDYETKNSYTVTVTATDSGSLTDTIAVTINVTEVVEDYGCATKGAVDTSNSGLVADCEALLRSRNRLEGSARLNWSEFIPIARWEGVTVSGGRVTKIDLRARGLNGTLPPALGDVSMLTNLNLRSNDLTGSIPASLNRLSNLEVLNLHSNMLNGEIPDLSGTVLQELYLTNNVRWNRDEDGERISRVEGTGLSGGVPAWLNTMTDLRELWLWGNNLSGTLPDLSRMSSLDKLKLNGNTGLTGFSAAKLPSGLRWLIAGETDVGATAPDLGGMTSMTTLWLNKTGLSGAIPVASIPTSVTNLNLKDNSLRTIPDMSGLDNLRYLYLHRNDLGGEIPGTLGDMASIERIWLHQNELTGISAGFANAADTLTHLYLDGNPFAGGTCLPGDLENVENNDFAAAGLAACQ